MRQTVKMLKTRPGVDDGDVYPKEYKEGETYEIGQSLLECFIQEGAVSVEPESSMNGNASELENKVVKDLETKPAKAGRGKK